MERTEKQYCWRILPFTFCDSDSQFIDTCKIRLHDTFSSAVPVITSRMDRVGAIYHFDSMASAGKYMDEMSMKPEFQELLKQASNLGTLVRAGFNIRI